jgi:hypothetical protein
MRRIVSSLLLFSLIALLGTPVHAQKSSTTLLDEFDRKRTAPEGWGLGSTPTEPNSIDWSHNGREVDGNNTDLTSEQTIRIDSVDKTAVLQSGATKHFKEASLNHGNVDSWPTTLDDAEGSVPGDSVSWAFNMRQNQNDPEGFDYENGEHGIMFVLAGGQGFTGSNAYAVALGQEGPDSLKIVYFNGGPGGGDNFEPIATWSKDLSDEYLSVQVTFDAEKGEWTLYAESDPDEYPRSDPRNVSVKRDSGVNTTETGNDLKYLGLFWSHGANDNAKAFFDDLYITNPNGDLPVEMAGFEAAATEGRGARLTWQTSSETNNAGFEVQRQVEASGQDARWEQVGYVPSKADGGTTTETLSYNYTAEDLPVGPHQFRLKQVDLDGTATLTDPVRVDVKLREALSLTAPTPNPSSTSAALSFAVKEQVETTISLYNTLGQQVAAVYKGTPQAGKQQSAQLDVSALPSGTYFLHLQAGDETATRRMTVVR